MDDAKVTPHIRLDAVSKSFSTRGGAEMQALKDVTLAVASGEFVSIVGASGCGKSTVLNLVAGLTEPSAGRIYMQGVEEENRRGRSGYMFQKDLLLPWRTVVENVSLGLEVLGVKKSRARARADELLERLGMGDFRGHHPFELSGGMRQRVALIRTLACDSDVLLLDEPFGSVDSLTRQDLQEWLLEVWSAERKTLIFVTHDIQEAVLLSDRVIVMSPRPGTVTADIPIPLERPRTKATVTTAEFNDLRQQIVACLYG